MDNQKSALGLVARMGHPSFGHHTAVAASKRQKILDSDERWFGFHLHLQ